MFASDETQRINLMIVSHKVYFLIFAALLLLTLTTYEVAFVDPGSGNREERSLRAEVNCVRISDHNIVGTPYVPLTLDASLSKGSSWDCSFSAS